MKLLDLAVLGTIGGLVYLTLKKKHAVPEPAAPVKAARKMLATAAKRKTRSNASHSSALTGNGHGHKVVTHDGGGSKSTHVVGRGVRH